MAPERWRQISAIYQQAAARTDNDRNAYLTHACEGDAELRREVEALLAQDSHASFLATPVRLSPGSRIGAYELVEVIGAGGMGIVYRARDLKLQRDVALKVLPEAVALDPDRIARFRREATVLASLNHPNIGAIHGFEDSGDVHALVLELVEGPTLADRIAQGAIPLDDALPIARQIAEALEAAHEQGIIHRDLKPANIKLRPDGTVKVLDFGLAKALEPIAEGGLDATASPTITSPAMTQMGIILGTAAYMSPEQAKGQKADAGSDIWAFGVVLFEMLTGKPCFDGDSVIEILGSVLRAEPDWTVLPLHTPPAVRSLLRRCLQKDRARRQRSIADARFQIEEAIHEPAAISVMTVPSRRGRERLWMVAASIAAIVVAVVLAIWFSSAPARPMETRLQVVTPPVVSWTSFAISPDGRSLVFQGLAKSKIQLYVRTLDSEKLQPLDGTENAFFPFWSPDNRSIGFFADGKLKRIDVAGGDARTLADANSPSGSWNSEGVILFALTATGPIQRVSADGGTVTPVTKVEPPRQVSHRFPWFLPDGHHFLYFSVGNAEGRGVYAGSLDSKESKRLFDAESAAVFLPPDRLLFMRQGTLFAQQFDAQKLETAGDPIPIAHSLNTNLNWTGEPSFSASKTGTIAYRPPGKNETELVWFNRSGRQIGVIGEPDSAVSQEIRLSPDARTVAISRSVGGNWDVWLIDVTRNVLHRLTTNPEEDGVPVWSPDNSRIAFTSRRNLGNQNIYFKLVNGTGSEEPLVESVENKIPFDWSSDDRFLLYGVTSAKTGGDLWALSLADKKSFPVVETNATEWSARLSSDGRWIAFTSDETGRYEIYVQPFPGPAAKSAPISTHGGIWPQWRADGKEIFYLDYDSRVMAVPVTLRANGQVESGAPVALFQLRPRSEYEVSRDGQRFLIHAPTEDASSSPITVVLNWAGLTTRK